MEDARIRKGKITKLYKKTIENMRSLGVYRPEFETTVRRYAELRMQYEILNDQWHENGCAITEEYTNKSGATNLRKTIIYLEMGSLRKELSELENLLGLTPKGLKALKAKGLEEQKQSMLDKVLSGSG